MPLFATMAPLKKLLFGLPPEEKIKQRISDGIYTYADRYSHDPILIAAIVWQESKGDPWAFRFEEKFYLTKIAPRTREQLSGWTPSIEELPTLKTEKVARAMSFGLMQLLLETARVVGYAERYGTELCVIETNLDVGCRYLQVCFERAHIAQTRGEIRHGWGIKEQALFYWNGGSGYPSLIRSVIETGKYREVLHERPRKSA